MFKESCVYFKNSVVAKEHDSQLGVVLSPRNIQQCLETFFIVTTEGVLLVSSGKRPGTLLNVAVVYQVCRKKPYHCSLDHHF